MSVGVRDGEAEGVGEREVEPGVEVEVEVVVMVSSEFLLRLLDILPSFSFFAYCL